MEKFMYPSPYMKITQGYGGEGSHRGTFAIDDGGSDSGKDFAIAPYSGTIKKICDLENEVWFVSDEPVEFANGIQDFATTMFVHQDSPMKYGMEVGKHYPQGEKIYVEGGRYKGQNGYFASHFHMEFARGTDANWHKNAQGVWMLNNSMPPQECCFIDNSYHILNDNGYRFVNIDKGIKYRVHCAEIGWQDWKRNGEMAGTTGEERRLEAIQIDYPEVEAKAHIEGIGWVDYGKVTKDTIIGTTGEKKRLECLCLKGAFKYRVHIEGSGWSCWTEADGICTLGSVGQSLRIEAIEMKEI